jgi:hypothetical protein
MRPGCRSSRPSLTFSWSATASKYGTITSISIAAHGCDVRGVAFCSTGAAWRTSGGVGYGYATFEAHATWGVTLVPFYNNTDVLTLTVPVG